MGCNFPETQLRDWLDQGAVQLDEHVAVCPRCRQIVERLRASGGSVDPSAPTASQAVIDSPARVPFGAVTGRIGHYTLKRVIASGAMGTTYEAVQEQPRRTVALKVMKHGVTSRALLRRFEQESQILARLRHPNIVEVYEAGVHEAAGVDGEPEPIPYFAMEYIPNAKSITEYAREKKLSTRQRIELFVKVCDAIHHGHGKGIIHRDLKPSNLLVDSAGEPRVIDFGVARTTDSDLAVTTLQTDVGQLIGTLLYMSPEQCDADPHDIDARSDVYALGVVLFELLTGALPYGRTRSSVPALSRTIRETPPTRPSRVDASVRGDLETIVLAALQKDRQRRYQAAADLGGDLQRYLAGEPILARGDSIAYVAGKGLKRQIRRHQFGWWATAVAAAFVIATFIGVPFIFRWTSLNNVYERLATVAVAATPETGALRTVRVIVLGDETDITTLAAAGGLEGVTATHTRSFRRLYGRLMEQLVDSGAGVVAFDLYFPRESEFDDDFVAGIRSLQDRGIEVIVGRERWLGPEHPEYPDVTPAVAREVGYGGLSAGMSARAPWRVHLALQRRDEEPMIGFATAVVGAYFKPGTNVLARLHVEDAQLQLRHYSNRPEPPYERVFIREPRWLDVTMVGPETDPRPEYHLFPDDMLAHYNLDMPDDSVLKSSTIALEDVFTADRQQLHSWFDDRIVLVQNIRNGADLRPHPGGRMIHGVYGHAVAVDTIVNRLSTHRKLGYAGEVTLAGALAGGLIGAWLARRHPRRAAVLVVVAAAAFALSLWAQREHQWLGNPMVPALAMVIASEMTAGLRRARLASE